MLKKNRIIIPTLVLAALVVAVIAFLYLYDFNSFKPMITQAVMDATGRELIIGGDLRIIPGWPPKLTAENVTFQNAPWGSRPQLASVKRLSFTISLMSILRGEYRFIHIHLFEPQVILEFNSSGISNFQFHSSGSGEPSVLPVVTFRDIRIQKGFFTYSDQKSSTNFSLNLERLQADIPGLDKPIRIQLQSVVKGLPFSLDGNIGPIVAWVKPGYPLPVDLTAGLGKTTAQLKGTIRDPINLKGITLKATASGQSTRELTNLGGLVDIPDFGVFSIGGEFNDGPGHLALERLAVHIGSEELDQFTLRGSVRNLLEIQDVKLDLQMQTKRVARLSQVGIPALAAEGPLRISASISDPSEKRYISDDISIMLGENTINGSMDLNLARKVPALDVKLKSKEFIFGPFSLDTSLAGPVDRISVEKLKLKLGTEKLVEAIVNGTIDNLKALDGVNLNFHVYGTDLANLQKLAGKPLPVCGAFALSGGITMPVQRKYQIPELKINLDNSSLVGSLDLDLGGLNPKLGGTFTSDRLNLKRLFKPTFLPANLLASMAEVGPTRIVFESSGPLDQPTLNRLEFQTSIKDLVEMNLQGSIDNLFDFSGIDLSFLARGNELENLEKVIGRNIPFKGPYFLSGDLENDAREKYRIESLKALVGLNKFEGHATVNLTGPNPIISAEIDTRRFTMQALSIEQHQILNRLKKVEDFGPLDLKATVIPSPDGVALRDLDFSAGNDALAKMRIKGSTSDLSSLKGMDFSFQVSGREKAILELIAGRKLPVRGPYELSGLISEHKPKSIKMSHLKFALGQNHLNGWVNINFTGKHPLVETELLADHIILEPLTLSEVDPLKEIPDLGPLNLSIKLSQADKSQGVHHLDFSLGNEDTIAAILRGTIRNIAPLGGIFLEFSVTGNDPSVLNNVFGTHYLNKMPIHIAGRLEDPEPGSYTIHSLKANYGDSNLAGSVSLKLVTDRPVLKAQISSQKMDLRSILETIRKTALSPDKSNKAPGNKDRVFSRKPFSLTLLDRLNADVTFRNQELLMPKFTLNNIDVNLSLKNGDLSVYPLKFIIGGGSAEGKLNMHSSKRTPSLKMALDVQQMDIGHILEQLEYETDLKGRMNASFDLAGNGDSVAALMESLNGKVFISMHDGRVHNDNLALLEKYMGSSILELLNPFKKKSPHTTINCLVNKMRIKNGGVKYKLVLDTDQTVLLVAGSIDLKTEKLDIGIKPTPKKSAGSSGAGSISFSLSKLSQPFRLGGTLAKPELVIDPAQMVLIAGKFAGAMALGPTGLVLFFSDISVGKKNICEEAFETMQSE